MKLINKFLYMVTAVATLFATSCTEQIEPAPAPKLEGQQVYFALDQQTKFSVLDAETVEVPVYRLTSDEAYQPKIRFEEVEGLSIEVASFEAGSEETKMVVSYDLTKFEVGETKKINVQISENTSEYGPSSLTLQFTYPEPWNDWGTGLYVDDFWNAIAAAAGANIPAGYVSPIKFQKHADNENRIRVVNPAAPEIFKNLWEMQLGFLDYNGYGDAYIEFDITDPNNVLLAENPTYLGVGANFGEDGILPLVLYINANEDGTYKAPITYKDGIITFPQNNVVMGYIMGEDLSGWYANTEGLMMFAIPGVVISDFSMAVEYGGMVVESDNATTSALLDFYLGGDVASFKFAVVPGNVADPTETVEAILAGSEEIDIYEGTSDETSFKVSLTDAGLYSVVMVPFDVNNEASVDDVVVSTFYFPGLGGNEVPEVEIGIAVDSIVGITGNPAYEANYPSATSMCIFMQADGTQLLSIAAYVGIDVPTEVSNEEVLASPNAEDFTGFIEDLIADGYALAVYTGLTEGQSYDIILGFKTIYGEHKTFRTAYTPKAAEVEEEEEETPETSRLALPAQLKSFVYSGN